MVLTIKTFGRLGNVIAQIIKCMCYSLSFEKPIIIDITELKRNNNFLIFLPNHIFEENGTNDIERYDTFWDETTFLKKTLKKQEKY